MKDLVIDTSRARETEGAFGDRLVSPQELYRLILIRSELALLDVREEGVYAQAHPLFAACLPLSQLEMQALDRVPRLATPIVIYDDDGQLVTRAHDGLKRLGYSDVRILDGGLDGWQRAGFEVFQDVNSASKAFGELVEARRHTPSVAAEDLQKMIAAGDKLMVLDARRFDEFQNMSIPGAISTPGAELVSGVETLALDPEARIIVNCAGRTRSIIGTQSLLNAGYEGRVAALRNGTIGWTLAGLKLDQGAQRRWDESSSLPSAAARRRARDVAYRAGVRLIDSETLALLRDDPHRTTYCFDVRQPGAYAQGHIKGFRNAPGGQLVQETDVHAPVRGAKIVLHDPQGSRADMTASWLAQMGWEVFVLSDDTPLDASGPDTSVTPPLPACSLIAADLLAEKIKAGAVEVLDLSPSTDRARGHISGSWFVIRAVLAEALEALSSSKPLVLCSADGRLAAFAAQEVQGLTDRPVSVLEGGLAAWRTRGLPTAPGLGKTLCPATDVYKRPYEGVGNGHSAMQAYLDWEYGLVEQLARDRTHGFVVI